MRFAPLFVCSLVALTSAPAGAAAKDVARSISKALGGGRVIHRPGAAYEIEVTPGQVEHGLAPGKSVARFSRALGLPHKDARGLAVRLPTRDGGHEDVLLVTAQGRGAIGRRLVTMTKSFVVPNYSSLRAHTVNGAQRTILADAMFTGTGGPDFAELDAAVERGEAVFQLDLPGPHNRGTFPLATIQLTRRLTPAESDGLKFAPFRNKLMPLGKIPFREGIYDGSQSTR